MRFLSLNVHTKFSRDFYHGEEKGREKDSERERDKRNVIIGKINEKCTWNMLYHIYKCVTCAELIYAYMYICICINVYMRVHIHIYMYIRADL